MAGAPSAYQNLDYGASRQRVTLVADGEVALRRARRLLEEDDSFAIRTLQLPELNSVRASGDLLWVELADAPPAEAVELLDAVQQHAASRSASSVVSATEEWIDLIAARIVSPDVTVLITADDVDRIAALGLATAVQTSGVRDNSADRSEGRLKQLSEEVNRIAMALARLSDTPLSQDTMRPVQPGEGPAVSAELIRSIIRARRLRDQFIPGNLFADPAWDILLDLLQAEIIQHRVPVSSLCIASAVPATTALRWIRTMTDRGMLLRREDPHDARRVFIELAAETSTAIRRYFDKVGSAAVV